MITIEKLLYLNDAFFIDSVYEPRASIAYTLYCISKAQECSLTAEPTPKRPFRVPSEVQLQLLAKSKKKANTKLA